MNKPIRLHLLTIIIRFVFSEDDKVYPQLFLDDALCELVWKMLQYEKVDAEKELM